MTLEAQLRKVVKDYCDKVQEPLVIEDIGAAIFTGIQVACETFIKNDGSHVVTAYKLLGTLKHMVSKLDLKTMKVESDE